MATDKPRGRRLLPWAPGLLSSPLIFLVAGLCGLAIANWLFNSTYQSPEAQKPSPMLTATASQDNTWNLDHAIDVHGEYARLQSQNSADFEGGNIGRIDRINGDNYDIYLRSDNDDALPDFWRRWWYFRLQDLPTDRPVTLTIKGAGQWAYYLPMFTDQGDQRDLNDDVWQQFKPSEVTQPTKLTLLIKHKFSSPVIWFARYVPYTYTRLNNFLKRILPHQDIHVGMLGKTLEGRAIPVVTIGNYIKNDVMQNTTNRQVVFIHARTHPGEVGSSFLLEGLIQQLLGSTSEAKWARQNLLIHILPMLNIDGVFHGNNRVSPQGVNFEGKWYSLSDNPLELDRKRTPLEVRSWWKFIKNCYKIGLKPIIALNLHSSSVEPQDRLFFFPHFGPESLGYDTIESRLYFKQKKFIEYVQSGLGPGWLSPVASDGTRSFLAKSVPESWWWRNFHDEVMALSIESTYGYTNQDGQWMTPEHMRQIGRAVAKAIAFYSQSHASQNAVSH